MSSFIFLLLKPLNMPPKIIPGVHIFFQRFNVELQENEYLLHKREHTGYMDNQYSVPGGHIEGHENPIDRVLREAKEEVNVEALDPKFVILIYRIKEKDNEVRIDLGCLVSKWNGEFKAGEPSKHSEPKWYALSKFPNNMVPYIRQAIMEYESGLNFTVAFS